MICITFGCVLIRIHIGLASSSIENVLFLVIQDSQERWRGHRCPDNRGSTVSVKSFGSIVIR